MLKFLPIMFLSNAQKVAHYAQYYAHNYFNHATVQVQILLLNQVCTGQRLVHAWFLESLQRR